MYLIDTNIFLEIMLKQKKSEECKFFLTQIQNSEDYFYVSSFSIHSIEVIMTKKNKIESLSKFLTFLSKSKIIRIDSTTQEEAEILDLMLSNQLDFDDALQLYLCQKNNLKIISYDKHFDQTQIKRVEPK